MTGRRAIRVALGIALVVCARADAAPDLSALGVDEIRERLRVVHETIAKQKRALAGMEAELEAARKAGRPPDVSLLGHYATASGQRTPAYHAEPAFLRELIDEVESNQAGNLTGVGMLAAGYAGGGEAGLARAHFRVEILRTRHFLGVLSREEARYAGALGAAAPGAAAAAGAGGAGAGPPTVVDLRVDCSWPEPRYPGDRMALELGRAAHLKAIATFEQDGRRWSADVTRDATWTPASHPNATVSATGAVHAVAHTGLGHVTIRAEYGGRTAHMQLQVIHPELRIAKRARPPAVVPGDDVIFVIEVENTGRESLHGLDVNDPSCPKLVKPIIRTIPANTIMAGQTLKFFCKYAVAAPATNTATAWAWYSPSGQQDFVQVSAATTVTAAVPAPDTEGPEITITSHRDGDRVRDPAITLRGTASDAAKGASGIWQVYVDLSQAAGGRSGGADPADWSRERVLSPGENVIEVLARDDSPAYNASTKTIRIHYDAPPAPKLAELRIEPTAPSAAPGESITFRAIARYHDGREVDVSADAETRWVPANPFTAGAAGDVEVSAIHRGRIASTTVRVEGPAPPPPVDLGRPPDGPPGGVFNILFKPDGTGRPNCFEFMLARVGGDRLSAPGVLTPGATRSGWSVDSAGGAGPWGGWSWKDPLQANARMMELSVYGDDWYGCRRTARVLPPAAGAGQVSPIPPGMPQYGIWRRHRMGDPPQCFEFASAPIEEAPRYDGQRGYEREPSFFGPWAKIDVSKITSQLSPYESDYYGCHTARARTAESLSVTPPRVELDWGESVALEAVAGFADGTTEVVTAQADWSAGPSFTGDRAGTHQVTASWGGQTGTATIVVREPGVVSLVVETDAPRIHRGQTAYFRAVATFADGREEDVTGEAVWDPGSFVNPTQTGPLRVTARYRGQSAGVEVEVEEDPSRRTGSFRIIDLTVAGAGGGAPMAGSALVATATVRVADFSGLVAVGWQRDSDGSGAGDLQMVDVTPGSEFPVRRSFPALPKDRQVGADAITLTVTDGGADTAVQTARFTWQRTDEFQGILVSGGRSGKPGSRFAPGSDVVVTSTWGIRPDAGATRTIGYYADGQKFAEENVGVAAGGQLVHTATLTVGPQQRGAVDLRVELVDPDGGRAVGAGSFLAAEGQDRIARARAGTGQGAVGSVFSVGATVFVSAEVETAEGKSGSRTLELRDRGSVLQSVSFASPGGERLVRSFSLDTSGFAAGPQALTVVLLDAGRSQDRTVVRFDLDAAATPPPRRTGGLQDVFCQADVLTVKVWDHSAQDGDIISVALGNQVVLSGVDLNACGGPSEPSGGPCVIPNVQIPAGGRTPLAVYAHNEGDSSPNTAALAVEGQCTPARQIWNLKTDQSAAIWISRQ